MIELPYICTPCSTVNMANLLPASEARARVQGDVHGPGFTGNARPVPEHNSFGGAFDSFVTNRWVCVCIGNT